MFFLKVPNHKVMSSQKCLESLFLVYQHHVLQQLLCLDVVGRAFAQGSQ